MIPEPGTILIIDDDRSGREVLEALLLSQGYNLVLAASGPEALQKLDEVQVDLILLDIMMPGMDGFEVCRRIRNTSAIADIPILVLTAMNDFRSRLAGFEAGADDYIPKPYDSLELFARVRTISRLNRYRRLVAERVKFQQLFDLSPNGQMVIDSSGVIHLTNKKALDFICVNSADEVVGSVLSGWILPGRQAEYLSVMEDFWKNPAQSRRLETWLAGKNCTIQPVEIVLGQIEFDGEPMAQVILIDTRERMQLSGALAKERTLLKTVMDTFPDFLYFKDLESHYLMANPALAGFHGIESPEQVIGKTDFDLFPAELAVRYLSDEQYLLRTTNAAIDQEEPMVDSLGARHWMQTIKAPLYNRNAELIGLIGIGRDITALKNARDGLKAAQAEKGIAERKITELGQTVARLARDRNHYLAYLASEASSLGERIAAQTRKLNTSGDSSPEIDLIRQAADQLMTLTTDILEYSRLEKQAFIAEPERFSLVERIRVVEGQMSALAAQKGLSFAVQFTPEVPEFICGDAKGLSEALVRLSENAICNTDAGEIRLLIEAENYSAQQEADEFYIHAAVSDTGIGIAKEEMIGLFQPFRIPVKTGMINNNSGLDLAICKKLVELMGGRIWAESEGVPGNGSTIHFTAQFHNEKPCATGLATNPAPSG